MANTNYQMPCQQQQQANMMKMVAPNSMNVKEAAVSWPPSGMSPVTGNSTIAQEQRNWQIPPIQNVAEQLMQQAVANGGPMPSSMYLPGFSLNLPQSISYSKMLPPHLCSPVWHFGPSLPATPISPPDNPNKPYLGQYMLSPLSNGGFLYVPNSSAPSTPSTPFTPLTPSTPSTPATPSTPGPQRPFYTTIDPQTAKKIEDEVTIKPSMVAQTRKEKVEKYRNKRSSRNWNRGVDPAKKAIASSRPRDGMGQFVSESEHVKEHVFLEVVKQLESTQKESRELQQESKELHKKLSAMERELAELRQKAIDARKNEENVKKELEYQQTLNQKLLNENQFLWQTVPHDEVFTTLNPDHAFVDREPFMAKIDLNGIDNTLVWTDSPYLGPRPTEEPLEP